MFTILSIIINLNVISRSHRWLQLIEGTICTTNERFDVISVIHPLNSQQKPISSDWRCCLLSEFRGTWWTGGRANRKRSKLKAKITFTPHKWCFQCCFSCGNTSVFLFHPFAKWNYCYVTLRKINFSVCSTNKTLLFI